MTPLMITQMARNAATRSAERAARASSYFTSEDPENRRTVASAPPVLPTRRCMFAYCSSAAPTSAPSPAAATPGSLASSRNEATSPRQRGPFGRCDSTSYAYCALAAALFLVGAFMFLFMYLSAAANDTTGRPSNLDDGWLVGPIFMCTGLLLGIKNLLYMRRAKLLFDLLLAQEQRAADRDFQEMESCVNRNASVVTLPPAYDVAVSMPLVSADRTKDSSNDVVSSSGCDAELPSYAEALRLLSDDGRTPPIQSERVFFVSDSPSNIAASRNGGQDDVDFGTPQYVASGTRRD